jgi:tetratricopeptide (TPR) repeat protein
LPIHAVGILLLISYFGWGIYKRLRPKDRNYTSFIKSGASYETYFRYKKAFEIYEKARQLPNLSPNQQAVLNFNCGSCLLKQKKYKRAAAYFDRLFEQEADHFLYMRQLKLVLKGYMLAGEREKAQALYEKYKSFEGSGRLTSFMKHCTFLGADLESK